MYGSSFHSGDVYEPQLPVSTADCQQVVNGLTPYHRTAVVPPLSQQQPPPPTTQTPYKWMQVKRNTPRPDSKTYLGNSKDSFYKSYPSLDT
ncbi:hypothetical protein CEXT_788501 [Caerostris extrusa]|uniref:Uncharacterized protein n=1 Tax=Caerostris extrusa TaxID=172846 RepID=A0AAV4N5H2_CAEEX|nr:hypothetical protein CEXT_788501 [Caerostris extrusa]